MNKLVGLVLLVLLAAPVSAQEHLPGTKLLNRAPWVGVSLPLVMDDSEQKFGEPPYVKMPTEVKVIQNSQGHYIPVDVSIVTNGKDVKWFYPPEGIYVFRAYSEPGTFKLVVMGLMDGQYRLNAYTALGDVPSDPAVCVVTVGKGPGPLPPIPPVPPDPIPPVPPTPIPVTGMHVLVVYESSVKNDTAKIMNSSPVVAYINAKCAKEADGKSPSARVLDKDANMNNTSKEMQAMMARPRTSVPWIVIMSSKGIVEQALPATVDETLALLRKVGG